MKNQDAKPIQSTVSPEYLEKIDAWAAKLNYPRAQMIRMLIEAACDDHKWILNALTSRIGLKLVDVVRKADEKPSATIRNNPATQ